LTVTLANTRSIYQHLDLDLLLEFERRGLTYRRVYRNAQNYDAESALNSANIHSWQNIFKTSQRNDVEKKCRENGLSYRWHSTGNIEIWNSAPACISHPDTGDRLWFNQIHLFKSSTRGSAQRKSILSKLFSVAGSPVAMEVDFSDGTPIPASYVDVLAAIHEKLELQFELQGGDFLVLDNALTAQGRHALHNSQRLLVTMY
jgi:hypothetical protein